jgi:hypothetical protein
MFDDDDEYIDEKEFEEMPLYQKGIEIQEVVEAIAGLVPEDDGYLHLFGFKEVEYFQIVRDLIEEYRVLFIEWISDFDKFPTKPQSAQIFLCELCLLRGKHIIY